MTPFQTNLLLLVAVGVVVGGISYAVRRLLPSLENLEPAPWASTLTYVATAYGVVLGFTILFLFGQYASARAAVGDEATSIGTAFDQAALFPNSSDGIQRALICYARSVPKYDWPAMRAGEGGSPEVDRTYNDLVASLGKGDLSTTGALHSATATNMAAQVGSISTSRETRLVAAETTVPTMLWVLLIAGGAFVLTLIFVQTLAAKPGTQAVLVGSSAVFTAVMVLLVFALNQPYSDGGGSVRPRLINETTATMVRAAPDLARAPCPVGR